MPLVVDHKENGLEFLIDEGLPSFGISDDGFTFFFAELIQKLIAVIRDLIQYELRLMLCIASA